MSAATGVAVYNLEEAAARYCDCTQAGHGKPTRMFARMLNHKSYTTCKADMLIKGQEK